MRIAIYGRLYSFLLFFQLFIVSFLFLYPEDSPMVIGIFEDGIQISRGSEHGVFIGAAGKVYYEESVGGKLVPIYIAKFSVVSVDIKYCRAKILEKTEKIEIGNKVIFDSLQRVTSRTKVAQELVPPLKFKLKVNTSPPNAKVYADGNYLGVTTIEQSINVGHHRIKIEKEGYKTIEEEIEIETDTTIKYELKEVGYEFDSSWGSEGSGDGQFMRPHGIALDNSGYVYVTDCDNNRIQKFTTTGTFITKWGSKGSGDGQFNFTGGIAADNLGYVYVVDAYNFRIQKFTSTGSFITKWGSRGSGDGQFLVGLGIAVDNSGYVYVSDFDNNRIQKFTSNGSFVTKWGSPGNGDGQFDRPGDIAVDNSGYVYVTDGGNSRIQKFTSSGTFIAKWGSEGSGDGQFMELGAIAVDSSGCVYTAERGNQRIQKFTSSGTFITKWGSYGSSDGQFQNPAKMAVDNFGCIYVADVFNARIQKFRPKN